MGCFARKKNELWLFGLLLLFETVHSENNFTVKKCCLIGETLNGNLKCVPVPKGMKLQEFYWFPMSSFRAEKLSKQFKNETILKLLKRSRFIYGERPQCSAAETDALVFNEVGHDFAIILNKEKMRVVITAKKTLLHFAGTVDDISPMSREHGVPEYQHKKQEKLRTFPMESICVDALLEKNRHVVFICPCSSAVCIRKCCKDYEYFDLGKGKCYSGDSATPSYRSWRPTNLEKEALENYYLLSDTYPSCNIPLLLKYNHEEYSSCNRFNKASDNQFTIFPNGSLKVQKYKTLFNTSQYCGEVTVSVNGTVEEQNLILCSASKIEEDIYKPITHTLYGVLLIIGGVCLLLTVSVSLFLPSLWKKVHNKIALSHNASLMVANFTWAVPQLFTGLSSKSCLVLAFLEQFTLLGSFFWLNVMCIDISMTFSSNRHLKSGRFDDGTKKFIYYCIYAWGSTTLISIVTMVMEFNPHITFDYLKPGFSCICGFNAANGSMLAYLYGPMTLLLLINMVLFVYTAIKIMSIQRQTAMLHKTDSNTTGGSSFQSDKQRYDPIQWLILYGKLFLLMGITWIMEIISWVIGGPSYYWYFSDILNLLRAVFIFILFICKRQVFKSLRRKLRGESQTFSEKTGSAKSHTDEMAVSTTTGENRDKAGIVGSNRKCFNKLESEVAKAPRTKGISNSFPVQESSM